MSATVTARRLSHNGSIEVSALVKDSMSGVFLNWEIYYGHTITAAKKLFRESMKDQGLKII